MKLSSSCFDIAHCRCASTWSTMCGSIVLVKWYIFFLGEKISKEQPKTRNKNKNILMMSKHTVRGGDTPKENFSLLLDLLQCSACQCVIVAGWRESIFGGDVSNYLHSYQQQTLHHSKWRKLLAWPFTFYVLFDSELRMSNSNRWKCEQN